MPDALSGYALSRLIFERSLALIYLIAFVCAANQFVPLLGEHGLLPVSRFVRTGSIRSDAQSFLPRADRPGVSHRRVARHRHIRGLVAGVLTAHSARRRDRVGDALAAVFVVRERRTDLLWVRVGIVAARNRVFRDFSRCVHAPPRACS